MYTVYQHINKINGKMYFGITKQNPENRWGANGCKYEESPHLYAAIQKYGWDNFYHNILFTECTKEQACEIEQYLIKACDTQNNAKGYNIMPGGTAPSMPQEVKDKIAKALVGNTNGLGHPCSEEKKNKIRDAQKGRPLTDEHKQKLSDAAKARHVPCSESKRKTLSKNYPKKRAVYCEETNLIYESVQECARQLHVDPATVSHVCSGVGKTVSGYHVQYYNDTINA